MILVVISLYHFFLVSFFPILRMVITLYIYSVYERMKERIKKTTIYQFEDSIRAMELKSWIFCRYGSSTTINLELARPIQDEPS